MVFSQDAGCGVPLIGVILALVFSGGLSFRPGTVSAVNSNNSLMELRVPLIKFA